MVTNKVRATSNNIQPRYVQYIEKGCCRCNLCRFSVSNYYDYHYYYNDHLYTTTG